MEKYREIKYMSLLTDVLTERNFSVTKMQPLKNMSDSLTVPLPTPAMTLWNCICVGK